jgi:major membrane immunogen (membrane-anchored lipoprotein)
MKKIISLALFSAILLTGCKGDGNEFNGAWKQINGSSDSPYLLEINCSDTCHVTSRSINNGNWAVIEADWLISDGTINHSGMSLEFNNGKLYGGNLVYQKIDSNNISSMMQEKERMDDKQRANDFMKKLEGN